MPGGVAPTAVGALSKTFQAASNAIYAISKAIYAVSKAIYVPSKSVYVVSKAIIWTRSSAELAWKPANAVLVGRISEPTSRRFQREGLEEREGVGRISEPTF